MTTECPHVTVVIPCRNERKYIGMCLDSVIANDYPPGRIEVLVVDGMSEDGTRPIVQDYARRFPFVSLMDNPRQITPSAINLGVAAARGDFVVLMGAHAAYAPDYLRRCVEAMAHYPADCVGGVLVTLPANDSARAHAIAIGLSHPFGVGNAYFRIGRTDPCWVDTVPFGCYRRPVFERIGGFDEELVRNQDDEFNYRVIRHGGRILLAPGIVSYYYARDSLRGLWRMYYQYGWFKPLVARKVGRLMTLRQVVPTLFVLGMLGSGLLAPLWWGMRVGLGGLIAAYATLAVGCAARVAVQRGVRCGLALGLVFPVMHLSYGLGFLMGALHLWVFGGRAAAAMAPIASSRPA